jgi:hypothetical protein
MKKYKLYRYIGRNGDIVSHILLEDIKPIALMELSPEEGYALTNGQETRTSSVLVHIDEVDEWKEVKADIIE